MFRGCWRVSGCGLLLAQTVENSVYERSNFRFLSHREGALRPLRTVDFDDPGVVRWSAPDGERVAEPL